MSGVDEDSRLVRFATVLVYGEDTDILEEIAAFIFRVMVAVSSFRTLVTVYQLTQYHILEDLGHQ